MICTYIAHTYYVPSANMSCAIGKEYSHHGEIDIGGVELHVDLLVDQSLTILMVVLPDLGHRHPHWRCAAVSRGGGTEALI